MFSNSRIMRLALVLGLGLAGCKKAQSVSRDEERTMKKPIIVTTTTMVTDLVRQIAGDSFELEPLMGPGVDPHLYKPSPEDMTKLNHAKVIIYSGLHLEGKMTDIFQQFVARDKLILGLGSLLAEEKVLKVAERQLDPHFWGDASLWAQVVPGVVKVLGKALPAQTSVFERRGVQVQRELLALHEDLKRQAGQLPHRNRVLVTSHDAFHYFGEAYGIEVIGVQGVSTVSEAGLSEVVRVIDLIKRKQVPTIFMESSVSPVTIQQLSKDSGTLVGEELLSDTLGQPGEMVEVKDGQIQTLEVDRGTVVGMLRSNMSRVVAGLLATNPHPVTHE